MTVTFMGNFSYWKDGNPKSCLSRILAMDPTGNTDVLC